MKEYLKKHSEFPIFLFVIWVIIVGLFVRAKQQYGDITDVVGSTEFTEASVMTQKQDKVGANIRLLQAIHGTNGTDYRYSVETDCPKWDFQTKYVTSTPIDWIDETSAVEVIIYDAQVRYDGTVYASGQYYTVPILGGISSETVSLEEWQKDIMVQAYQTYVSNTSKNIQILTVLKQCIFVIPILLLIWLFGVYLWIKSELGNKIKKAWNQPSGILDFSDVHETLHKQIDELRDNDKETE